MCAAHPKPCTHNPQAREFAARGSSRRGAHVRGRALRCESGNGKGKKRNQKRALYTGQKRPTNTWGAQICEMRPDGPMEETFEATNLEANDWSLGLLRHLGIPQKETLKKTL